MAVVSVPERIYRTVRRHLLPCWHRVEEAAFLYAMPTRDAFDYLEWFPVPASGFVSRSSYHLELNDDTRAKVIKRAHDLGASIVELHSHVGWERARFSPSDVAGFREFVPHVLWRLKHLPISRRRYDTHWVRRFRMEGQSKRARTIAGYSGGQPLAHTHQALSVP